jgi:hypothetical protein
MYRYRRMRQLVQHDTAQGNVDYIQRFMCRWLNGNKTITRFVKNMISPC